MKTLLNLRTEERSFVTIIFLAHFRPGNRPLNFKLNLLVTFDLKAVHNFWCQIRNQHNQIVTILDFEENRWTFWSPPTHPPTRTTCGRVHSHWKKYLKRHYCGLRASGGVWSSFFYVTFLDFLAAEIQFFMIFRFSLGYVCVFGNRQISSLEKYINRS